MSFPHYPGPSGAIAGHDDDSDDGGGGGGRRKKEEEDSHRRFPWVAQAGNGKPKAMIKEIPVGLKSGFIGHPIPVGPSCWV